PGLHRRRQLPALAPRHAGDRPAATTPPPRRLRPHLRPEPGCAGHRVGAHAGYPPPRRERGEPRLRPLPHSEALTPALRRRGGRAGGGGARGGEPRPVASAPAPPDLRATPARRARLPPRPGEHPPEDGPVRPGPRGAGPCRGPGLRPALARG